MKMSRRCYPWCDGDCPSVLRVRLPYDAGGASYRLKCDLFFHTTLQGDRLFGPKLKFTMFQNLGLRRDLAAGDTPEMFKDLRPDLGDGFSTFDNVAGRDVDVLRHPFKDSIVRCKLDYRCDRISDGRSVAGREDHGGGTRGDQTRCRLLVVPRTLHQIHATHR